jgi:hypothetical protein
MKTGSLSRVVDFQGVTITCDSEADASAIRAAQTALGAGDLSPINQVDVQDLAGTLERYGFPDSGRQLRALANRFRVTQR